MAERRPLTEGLKPSGTPAAPPVDSQLEKEFVYGAKAAKESSPPRSTVSQNVSRVPLSTRMRGDFAAALKRASLERQLNGLDPNTLQDILEQALEPWLRSNGYIS
jgi:hypothetical protein